MKVGLPQDETTEVGALVHPEHFEKVMSYVEIGKTEGRTGQVVLEPQSEVTAQYVTIWFTSLAPSDDGRYRASLGEVTVR